MSHSSLNAEEDFRDRYLLAGKASGPSEPREIDSLERNLSAKLPAAYRAYLRVSGSVPPATLVGSDCTLSLVLENTLCAKVIVAECGVEEKFPNGIFVFLMHQGYQFFYFELHNGEDPPVYHYHEGDPEPLRVAEHFSHWVLFST